VTSLTGDLHLAFLNALAGQVLGYGEIEAKPIEVDLAPPLPPALRVYMYSLVDGGVQRPNEYKAVLRVAGQRVGEYASFEHSDGRLTILVAYRTDLNVFVMWDASLHARFKNGGNIQVRDGVVHEAAAVGWAVQQRKLSSGVSETVIACRPSELGRALSARVGSTGGERMV
jgi:hypothetical protein